MVIFAIFQTRGMLNQQTRDERGSITERRLFSGSRPRIVNPREIIRPRRSACGSIEANFNFTYFQPARRDLE